MQRKTFDPVSTYRLQFHKGFGLADLEMVIPFLHELGIKTVYASPIFKAVPGSMHGYDVTDPNVMNPEIGTLEQLRKICARLKDAGISWIQDIVPNHMALHSDNAWLMDVLEHGSSSRYATYFDIDWEHGDLNGKLMLPILGTSPDEAIADNSVKVVSSNGKLCLKCYDAMLPLNSRSVSNFKLDTKTGEYINSDHELLIRLLDEQHYTLTNWAETDKRINYRRFFTVNSLICLNIQYEQVFNEYHQLIRQLCDEDLFQGLRVDHIDGLYDPLEYLERLRLLAGDDRYIVVEKILEYGEKLPAEWPIQGTTGYDFLGAVNNVFTNHKSKKVLSKLYATETSEHAEFNEMLRNRKALILYGNMQGELDNLYLLLLMADRTGNIDARDIPEDVMKKVLGEFLIQCPVYKYYGALPLKSEEMHALKEVLKKVSERDKKYKRGVGILTSIFLASDDADITAEMSYFYKRCMQFTGPLMAKGMEDTLMYNYDRFIAHNEVGDTPKAFGHSLDEFHAYIKDRQQNWPLAMNATATHDTKRGEDARARLNVLSDLPKEWAEAVRAWQRSYKADIDNNDAYFLLQSVVGCHPMPGQEDNFSQRLKEYTQKALREGKAYTSWAAPNEEYEGKAAKYVDLLLDSTEGLVASMGTLFTEICDAGIVNSLAQVALRLTCPGVPDTYQGTGSWDLSMVDPDNRRPVDHDKQMTWLNELQAERQVATDNLWETRYTGKIKLWLTNLLLYERAAAPDTFANGVYSPLPVKGRYRDNILAYMRSDYDAAYVVVVPLHIAAIARKQHVALTDIDWKDTMIELPDDSGQAWSDLVSGAKIDSKLSINTAFTELPIAVLRSKIKDSGRRAGVLLPVFCLPSKFGIGDFGPSAYKFADVLAATRQRYWQLLPLSPTLKERDHSPYSSSSGMAINTLFISPDLLLQGGLLTDNDMPNSLVSDYNQVDYEFSDKLKDELCDRAYSNFMSGRFIACRCRFDAFCKDQHYWLDDFALFVLIKRYHDNKPWYEWPFEYKQRDNSALQHFHDTHGEELRKIKWQQYLADEQWQALRCYCARKQVTLFGDMPFYVSYDSADVWAAPGLFRVDKQGKMIGNSGVPPDYFSKTGQLWNMPTYNWGALKVDGYQWWITRLKRNLELFNLIRLDHFRAFEAYWEVPADEETAVNGKWAKGPGMDLFNALRQAFGGLPFVAEDLGYEMDDVYALREKTGLPGMKVLEFAWASNMPVSPDTPHNYPQNCFVYTGTHDNNTVLGWYKQETTKEDRKRLEQYTGTKVNEMNIVATLIRIAYSSVARVAILPVQDILGLGSEARINMPGSSNGNWLWRMSPDALDNKIKKELLALTKMFNR